MFKKFILNKAGKISITKAGLWLTGAAATLLTSGILPVAAIATVKVIGVVGLILSGTGARDAIDKINPVK